MIINIPEANDIYFSDTREYFKEVLSSYASSNYRSAVVMLYSVVICDMLLKLRELRDMYNDTVAADILSEVEKSRNANDNKSKSKWEKEFVDNVYHKTELLDLEAYTNLNHLYDHRNFSAHPALNDNYKLVSPTKETTIACIKNALKDILVKPPVFIKKVVDLLTDELDGKYELFKDNDEVFDNYLNNKYYSKMSNTMKTSTFRSLWKICFVCTDEKSKSNRNINRSALSLLYKSNPSIFNEAIKNEQEKYKVAYEKNAILYLVGFIAEFTSVFELLSEEIQLIIDKQIKKDKNDSLISWYEFKSYEEYFKFIASLGFIQTEPNRIKFMTKHFKTVGVLGQFIDYLIDNYSICTSYESSMHTFESSIEPLLSMMNREQFVALISAVNNNNQNYDRWFNTRDNSTIVKYAKTYLGKEFDFSEYPNFRFNEKILSDTDEDEGNNNSEQEIFD